IQTRTDVFLEIENNVSTGVGMASGLANVSMPSGDGITGNYKRLSQKASELRDAIGECEYSHLRSDFEIIEEMLSGIVQTVNGQRQKENVTITAYQSGSIAKMQGFQKLKEASARQNANLKGSTKELEEAIQGYAQKQQERDLSEEREQEGKRQIINGLLVTAFAIVSAGAMIVTFGT
ncbi:hypothetical protein, partial [Lachnotalea glycerini]